MVGTNALRSAGFLALLFSSTTGPVFADGPEAPGVIKSELSNPELSGYAPPEFQMEATGGAAATTTAGDPVSGVVTGAIFNPHLLDAPTGGAGAMSYSPMSRASSVDVAREELAPEDAASAPEEATAEVAADLSDVAPMVETPAAETIPHRPGPTGLPRAAEDEFLLAAAALLVVALSSGLAALGTLWQRRGH